MGGFQNNFKEVLLLRTRRLKGMSVLGFSRRVLQGKDAMAILVQFNLSNAMPDKRPGHCKTGITSMAQETSESRSYQNSGVLQLSEEE